MVEFISRRRSLQGLSCLLATSVSGCGTWIRDEDIGVGDLKGRVYVEWIGEDRFVYRRTDKPLSFRPSFFPKTVAIVPDDMFTDGGSVPRVFWSIPGLSPWALGPAYIIHDWLFVAHRCGLTVPSEVRAITFEQSAIVLAEVARALIESGLIKHDMLDAIVWAVRTRYARGLWDRPAQGNECTPPSRVRSAGRVVANFEIPPKRR